MVLIHDTGSRNIEGLGDFVTGDEDIPDVGLLSSVEPIPGAYILPSWKRLLYNHGPCHGSSHPIFQPFLCNYGGQHILQGM